MTSRLTLKDINILLGREKPKNAPDKPHPPKQLSYDEAEKLRRANRDKRRMK